MTPNSEPVRLHNLRRPVSVAGNPTKACRLSHDTRRQVVGICCERLTAVYRANFALAKHGGETQKETSRSSIHPRREPKSCLLAMFQGTGVGILRALIFALAISLSSGQCYLEDSSNEMCAVCWTTPPGGVTKGAACPSMVSYLPSETHQQWQFQLWSGRGFVISFRTK